MTPGFPCDFHPAIIEWFSNKFGEPTQPQREGWPLIGSGCNTLILAPTGSGKTLAAFLAGINRVLCDIENGTAPAHGVEILYISPLKALNYDIERNLAEPLTEIHKTAIEMGYNPAQITTAVRTGDTPANERRKTLNKPPHILITTPESLHIMLTSSAAEIMETVKYVIVDEIHALSNNKRGVFLSVLMERLENLCKAPPVRIGLSATQKPLSEVARFLGGFDDSGNPRPVEIVDTGVKRQVDLRVVCTCEDLRNPGDGSVWPSIFRRCLDLINAHKSTIIFANTRRIVEKLTLGINDLAGEEIVRPHHGSVSAPMRRRTEEALKSGVLRGVIATGTLELGIDMGAVELVCQIESPKEVSRGLQRVGRAGHVYTAVSKGRIIPKTNFDLAEAVSVAKGMLEGDVEPISVPKNCLDVLAQQIVSMAALDGVFWQDMYKLVRRTYTYSDLSEEAFHLTLQLVSGRYPSKAFKDLRARVSFDRVTGRVSPLPGSQRLVIANGGAIPDTGQYGVYLSEANLKIGELDEEFVYESREGDVFSLGTNNWKILKIETDRVIVGHGHPTQARMPFWKGENVPRSARAGRRMGELLRELELQADDAVEWSMQNLPVDGRAAENLSKFIQVQAGSSNKSGLPTDKRIVIESFTDDIGAPRLALLTVFGGRIHQALRIAISALIKKHIGIEPETISGDNGVLFKLPDGNLVDPDQLLRLLTPGAAYDLITQDLPNTALFGLRFRQNAARALLLPGAGPGKRTPLWLQRLKAKDLLAIAKRFDGFPVVVETFRECLQDYLELDELKNILEQIHSGEIEVSIIDRQIPSPLSASMLFDFQMIYQYEWDAPKSAALRKAAPNERRLIDELIDGRVSRLLDERAISDLDGLLQGRGERYKARTAEELYERLRRIGDIPDLGAIDWTADPEFLETLIRDGRLVRVHLPGAFKPDRLAACDYLEEYIKAGEGSSEAIYEIIERHFNNRCSVCPNEIAEDYGFPYEMVKHCAEEFIAAGKLVEIPPSPDSDHSRFISPDNLEIVYRRTLAFQKSESRAVSHARYSDFLLHWQHLHPDNRVSAQDGLRGVLRQLEAVQAPFAIWESDILSRRIDGFKAEHIDNMCLSAEFIWIGDSSEDSKSGNIAFLAREGAPALVHLLDGNGSTKQTSPEKEAVRRCLKEKGASFLIDIVVETGLESRVVGKLLWEMTWSGEVTHDYFKTLRTAKPEQSASRTKEHKPAGYTDRRQFYRTRSKIAKSFSQNPNAHPGRWMLISALIRDEADENESLEIYARILLERYGIVAKGIVQRPGEPQVPWGRLYDIYQRMELSGEIERGYFIDNMEGAQFGLCGAVDILQDRNSVDGLSAPKESKPVLINSCDPAYLYAASGSFDSGFGRVNRAVSNYVIVLNGLPAVTIEIGAKRVNVSENINMADIEKCLAEIPRLMDNPWPIRPYRKLELTYLGTEPLIGTRVGDIIRESGFEQGSKSLTLYRSVY